tara:strand:- start:325 stop:444 length:120 start_codon:yes stop_codon:yes gene_type:complete
MKDALVMIRLSKAEKMELQKRSSALHISMSALIRMKTLA